MSLIRSRAACFGLLAFLVGAGASCSSPAVGEGIRLRGHHVPLVRRERPPRVLDRSSRLHRREHPPDSNVRLVVDLGRTLDWDRLENLLDQLGIPPRARAPWILEALEQVGQSNLALFAPLGKRLKQEGQLRDEPRALPGIQRVEVLTTPLGIDWLEARDEVVGLDVPPRTPPGAAAESRAHPEGPLPGAWAPRAAGAEAGWSRGLRGAGSRVALIDSGWNAEHEALSGRSVVSRPFGPVRPGDHGNAVLSVALGRTPEGTALGPAPEASWLAADPFPDGDFRPEVFDSIVTWLLQEGADVAILPFDVASGRGASILRDALSAWRSAGIVVLVAAGNVGPGRGRNLPPAHLGHLGPGDAPVLSIGAVSRKGERYAFTAWGPSASTGELFPLLAAPGDDVLVARAAPDGYGSASGTSFAVGVVGGLVALLRQLDPELSVREIEAVLTSTARDLGEPGPEIIHGHGLVDLAAALRELDRRVTEARPGQDRVDDATGGPVGDR